MGCYIDRLGRLTSPLNTWLALCPSVEFTTSWPVTIAGQNRRTNINSGELKEENKEG